MIFRKKKAVPEPSAPVSHDPAPPEYPAEAEESFDEVRVRPGNTVQLGDEQVVFLPENGDPPAILNTQEAEILQRCVVFDSIENHAFRYCQETLHDPSHCSYIEEVIEGFADRGLLLDRSKLEERWGSGEAQAAMEISSFSSLTCDRVDAVKRCLAGFAESFARHGRSCDFTLIDNSHSDESLRGNQAGLQELSNKNQFDFFYCGPEEKEAFIEGMRVKGFPEHVLSFALFGDPEIRFRTGANRNAQLLIFAGQTFFTADDDVICRISPSENLQDELDFFPGLDPTEFQFFARREEALDSMETEDVDLLSRHERLLGRGVRSLLHAEGGAGRTNLDNASPEVLRALETDRGKVAVTSNGLVGDSGMGLTTYPLFLSFDNRDALLSSDDDYEAFATARNVKRCAPSYVLTSSNFFMATSCSFDLSGLVPPFYPVNRNSDGIFANTLRAFDPLQFIGHLPYAIAHDPVTTREVSWAENLAGSTWPRASDVVNYCMRSYSGPSSGDDPRSTMMALGEHLRSLGSLSPSDFGAFVRDSWAGGVGANVSHLERLLTYYGEEPSHWAENVYEYMDALKGSLEKMGEPGSLEVAEGTSLSFNIARSKDWVAQYGELLVYWPDLFEEAKKKREQGERIARKI